MTRDQFIDYWLSNAKIESARRTEGGVYAAGSDLVALECACGEDDCQGWAMVPNHPTIIAFHIRYKAPKEPRQPQSDLKH